MNLVISSETEQRELEARRVELRKLEDSLAVSETELSVLQTAIREFEITYLETIGQKFDDLAEIEKQIQIVMGERATEDDYTISQDLECGQTKFHASENLKKLYREVARLCHPDLAGNEEDRELRHRLMIAANQAYENGSEEHLQAMLSTENNFVDLARQSLRASDFAQVIRAIRTTEERHDEVEAEIIRVRNSELYRLHQRALRAEAIGHNFLLELVEQVERQIRKAKNRLATMSADLASMRT